MDGSQRRKKQAPKEVKEDEAVAVKQEATSLNGNQAAALAEVQIGHGVSHLQVDAGSQSGRDRRRTQAPKEVRGDGTTLTTDATATAKLGEREQVGAEVGQQQKQEQKSNPTLFKEGRAVITPYLVHRERSGGPPNGPFLVPIANG